jgi:hypothetical protein
MPLKKKAKTTDKPRKAALKVKLMDITYEAW